jgi:pimeloyl-ACP methyl ester carboxylesterase
VLSYFCPDGRCLRYESFGNGPPVLLLHGYLDSHKSFFRLFEALSAHHTIIALDQRGHGESDQAQDYSIAGFASDVIYFLDYLVPGPVHIVGHSLGGIVAQRVAQFRPDLVKSLALISTARTAAGNPALAAAAPPLAEFSHYVPDSLAREFQASTTHNPLPDDIFTVYLAETAKVSLAAWRGALDGLLTEPPPPDTAITLPTLIIWGENDGLFSAADEEGLRGFLPQAYFLPLPATGHAPNWERPEACITALTAFWREVA